MGKVEEVNNSLALQEMEGKSGIGHTRWATHDGIIDYNAHPHSACTGKLAIVHNGIIENHEELKDELLKLGHKFKSDTDSEVIAHLIEQYWSYNMDVKGAMLNTCNRLKGSFAFVAIFDDSTLCALRYDEPLIVGVTDSGYFYLVMYWVFLTIPKRSYFWIIETWLFSKGTIFL
jgi:glucosamine--fructose-6-phosphate aminotransferase (isomerizing)